MRKGREITEKFEGSIDFFSSPSERERLLITRQGAVLAFCLVMMLFLSSFFQNLLLGIGKLINKDLFFSELYTQIAVLLSYCASLALPFSLFGAFTQIPVEKALRNRKTPFLTLTSAVFVCLGVSVVGMFSSAAVTFILGRLGIVFETSFSFPPKDAAAFLVYLLNMTIVPAAMEEIAFRGFLMQSLRKFGDGFALFASAFCFSLIHIIPTRFPHTFIMGLAIGYFVLFTGSLKTGIIIHFIYNSVITCMSLLGDRGIVNGDILNIICQSAMLFLALPSLLYLFKNYSGMFSLKKGKSVNPASANIRTFVKCRGMIIFYVLVAVLIFKSAVAL